MKLFQIEEPDGSPLDVEGAGAAVGIDIVPGGVGRVAVAVGGNGEILPDADGERTLRARDLPNLLLGLRSRAEKQLARPVTHAVIAADADDRTGLAAAAARAGLEILRLVDRATAAALVRDAAPEEAAVLGAAVAAEEVMPASPAT
jgi:Hsp70 protein